MPFRPLTDFLKYHTHYLRPFHPPYADHFCAVCLTHASDSHERYIRIDLPACTHIFGADCFELHIQHANTCPLCRTMWFEERVQTREGVERTTVVVVEEGGVGEALRRLRGERALGAVGGVAGVSLRIEEQSDTEVESPTSGGYTWTEESDGSQSYRGASLEEGEIETPTTLPARSYPLRSATSEAAERRRRVREREAESGSTGSEPPRRRQRRC
jgi:hypothetical protein